MPIIHRGYYHNRKDKYKVWIQPLTDKLEITNRKNINKGLFRVLKEKAIINSEPSFSIGPLNICSRYYFDVRRIKALTRMIGPGYIPKIVSFGKIIMPKNLSHMNEFEAIVGSLCNDSRFLIPAVDPDADLSKFNLN
jgi:hypothetical protein